MSFRSKIQLELKIALNMKVMFNPNQSDLGLIQTKFSIRIIPTLDSFGLLPRIKSDWFGLMFNRFSSNETQNVFRIGSGWFALARIQISEWIGIVLINWEWISIRYFRQGYSLNPNQSNFHWLNQWFAFSLIHQWKNIFTDKSVNFHWPNQLIFVEVISEIWLIDSNLFLAIWISQILLIISWFWLISI